MKLTRDCQQWQILSSVTIFVKKWNSWWGDLQNIFWCGCVWLHICVCVLFSGCEWNQESGTPHWALRALITVWGWRGGLVHSFFLPPLSLHPSLYQLTRWEASPWELSYIWTSNNSAVIDSTPCYYWYHGDGQGSPFLPGRSECWKAREREIEYLAQRACIINDHPGRWVVSWKCPATTEIAGSHAHI